MYDLSYTGGEVSTLGGGALDGEFIRLHVFKYICGASVDVPAMRAFAAERICEAADFFADFVPRVLAGEETVDLRPLLGPMKIALQMTFGQGAGTLMIQLREALGELMRAMKLMLWRDEFFCASLAQGIGEEDLGPLWTRTECELMILQPPHRCQHHGSARWLPSPLGSSLPPEGRPEGA